jgi:hypothetical protein
MEGEESAAVLSLLDLPDPCLLAVLQCVAADDQRSLFSAARAHSRLHQAAAAALRSITAVLAIQQQVEGVLHYLSLYGQHFYSLNLTGNDERSGDIFELPPNVQLHSLQLSGFNLQLQPGGGLHGVLGAAASVAALKQLRLKDCIVVDSGASKGLAAALSQLPCLEHLCLNDVRVKPGAGPYIEPLKLLTAVFLRLQQLTHLELARIPVQGSEEATAALQPLQALTRLVDLRLEQIGDFSITPSMLSGTQKLTRLQVKLGKLQPGALAGNTQLQHLQVTLCSLSGKAEALLSHLQPLQQLTNLCLSYSCQFRADGPPAAACAALTASSRLQQLDLSGCQLPAGAWQHLFPAGRQLPQLQSLDVSLVKQPTSGYAAIPDISRLVSCCPSLQCLKLRGLQIEPNLLQGLSGLHTLQTLHLTAAEPMQQTLDVVCQLTRLKQLHVDLTEPSQEGLMLQLTQLRQLTALTCRRCWPRAFGGVDLSSEVSTRVSNGGRGLAPVQGCSP